MYDYWKKRVERGIEVVDIIYDTVLKKDSLFRALAEAPHKQAATSLVKTSNADVTEVLEIMGEVDCVEASNFPPEFCDLFELSTLHLAEKLNWYWMHQLKNRGLSAHLINVMCDPLLTTLDTHLIVSMCDRMFNRSGLVPVELLKHFINKHSSEPIFDGWHRVHSEIFDLVDEQYFSKKPPCCLVEDVPFRQRIWNSYLDDHDHDHRLYGRSHSTFNCWGEEDFRNQKKTVKVKALSLLQCTELAYLKDFSDFRSFIQRATPCKELFKWLLYALDLFSHEHPEEGQILFDYIEGHLRHWPDETRHLSERYWTHDPYLYLGRSLDLGELWQEVSTGVPTDHITCVRISSTRINAFLRKVNTHPIPSMPFVTHLFIDSEAEVWESTSKLRALFPNLTHMYYWEVELEV